MITDKEYKELAGSFGLPISSVKAIDEVESSGKGFDSKTGKIIIQFEPHYFKRISKLISGLWAKNKVDTQVKEWEAFNDAFKRNPTAAMESCSIGRMQVMGEQISCFLIFNQTTTLVIDDISAIKYRVF